MYGLAWYHSMKIKGISIVKKEKRYILFSLLVQSFRNEIQRLFDNFYQMVSSCGVPVYPIRVFYNNTELYLFSPHLHQTSFDRST